MTLDRIPRVVAVSHRSGHAVHLRFDDGVEGDIDLAPIIAPFTGVLAPLADPAFVAQVRVHPEFGTITWPGNLDLDPVVLYCAVKGAPVPTFDDAVPVRRRRGERSTGKRATRSGRARGRGPAGRRSRKTQT